MKKQDRIYLIILAIPITASIIIGMSIGHSMCLDKNHDELKIRTIQECTTTCEWK